MYLIAAYILLFSALFRIVCLQLDFFFTQKKARSKSELKCTPRMEGQIRYISGLIQVCQSRSWTPITNLVSAPSRRGHLPRSCLDAKFKGLDNGKGDGFYWLNPSGVDDLTNAFVAYCDMTSAGGGWMLAAKVTHDYAWICPERKGSSCFDSTVDPLKANLFHSSHARDFVDLRITQDENSGVHLKKTLIRKIFESKYADKTLPVFRCRTLAFPA